MSPYDARLMEMFLFFGIAYFVVEIIDAILNWFTRDGE